MQTSDASGSSADNQTRDGGTIREDLKEEGRQLGEEAQNTLRAQALSEAEKRKYTASRTVSHSAEALESAADTFRDQGEQILAQTTSNMAQHLSEFADTLDGRNAEDLAAEVGRLARRNPGLFLLGGVSAGFVLSRFLKASAQGSASQGSGPL